MASARAIRTFLAALLVAAQFATGALAAQMAVQGAPCPVHRALASGEEHASAHHGHRADAGPAGHAHGHDHEQRSGNGDDNAVPHFNSACCAACIAAVTTPDTLLQTPGWLRRPPLPAAQGLEPGELPGTDPPPRILL